MPRAPAVKEESQSRRITVSPPRLAPVSPWWGLRPRTAIVAAGVITAGAVALAFGGYRTRTAAAPADPTSTSVAARAPHDEPSAAPSPNRPFTEPTGDPRQRVEGPAVTPSTSAEHLDPGHRLGHPQGPYVSPSLPPHGGGLHALPADTAPVAPPLPPPAATDPASDPMLRRPDGKPKVQLERDNPWP
jgi:hypothetical protein